MPLPANGKRVKLGKGSLLLDVYNAAGNATGFQFAGNATQVAVSAEVTKDALYSSTQRTGAKFAEAVTRIAYTIQVTLNEYGLDMLKKFFLATSNVKTQNVGTGLTANFTGDQVVPGRYLDVGKRKITNAVVTRDGTDVLVAGTDYVVYSEHGLILLKTGGAVLAGDDIEVEFNCPAATIDQLRLALDGSPVAHLLFLSDDANQDNEGGRDRLEIWRANIAPEGQLQLVSESFGSYQLTIGVLEDSENHPDDPFGTLDRVRA